MSDPKYSAAYLLHPVKRRKRCFAETVRFRRNWLKRLWNGYGKGKARGLRVFNSRRYEYGGRR